MYASVADRSRLSKSSACATRGRGATSPRLVATTEAVAQSSVSLLHRSCFGSARSTWIGVFMSLGEITSPLALVTHRRRRAEVGAVVVERHAHGARVSLAASSSYRCALRRRERQPGHQLLRTLITEGPSLFGGH